MRFVDLYCGAGGMSLGLVQAGWEHVRGFDLDQSAVLTYRNNIGEAMVCDLDERGYVVHQEQSVDLIAGGPPCQGFSSQNKNHVGDPRKNHVLTFARVVAHNRPRAFLMENVVSLVGRRGQNVMEGLRSVLGGSYYIDAIKLYAQDHGLAQNRGRVFIYGFLGRCNCAGVPFDYRDVPRVTIRDAISSLPEPPEDGSCHPDYFNHYRFNMSSENLERIRHVPPGGGWRDIPEHLQLPCHRNIKDGSGGWPDVFGRLSWVGQAPTITTNFFTPTKGRHAHPSADRCITPREAARLQGFPDDFEFIGNRTQVRTQIGNAVPPPMARFMGEFIMEALSR